jgi:hypothetical protein
MSNDHWESEMGRELGERARSLDDAPFSLDQVKGRAARIKRNRRLAAAGTVLAVAAVSVPVSVLAGQGLTGRTDGDVPPASQSSDPTGITTTATEQGGSGVGVDYLEDRTWVRSEGEPVRLGSAYSGGVLLDDLLVGVRNDDDTGVKTLEVVDTDGEVVETVRGVAAAPVGNDEGTALAYLTTEGDLVVRTQDHSRTVARGLGDGGRPIALVGDCDADDSDCLLYLDPGDEGETPTQVVAADGSMRDAVTADPAPIGMTDAGGDIVAAQLSHEDAGACFALYDVTSADYAFQTCDYALLDVDPAGSRVAVTHAYLDGAGNAWAGILDERRQVVARLDPRDGIVGADAWADDGSLLVTVFDRGERAWSIWRLHPEGDVERLVGAGTGTGTEETSYYWLLG